MKKNLALLLALLMTFSLCACQSTPKESPNSTESAQPSASPSTLKDGVYSQTVYGNSYSMPFSVDVTIEGGKIKAIEVTDRGGESSEYDDGIIESVIDKLIPRILEHQSLSVDSIKIGRAHV